jgi:hypothetical protein
MTRIQITKAITPPLVLKRHSGQFQLGQIRANSDHEVVEKTQAVVVRYCPSLGRMYAVRGPYSKTVGQCPKNRRLCLIAPDDVLARR